MRRTLGAPPIVALLLIASAAWSAPHPSPPATPKATSRKTSGDWPDTPTATLARRWAEAFSKGEKAMKETLPEILAPEVLAKRSMEERIESYRSLHDRLGPLMLVKIQSSSPDSLVASLASSDMTQRLFVFSFQATDPHKLTSVTIREFQSHLGFHH
jgi:hypothetical protein